MREGICVFPSLPDSRRRQWHLAWEHACSICAMNIEWIWPRVEGTWVESLEHDKCELFCPAGCREGARCPSRHSSIKERNAEQRRQAYS